MPRVTSKQWVLGDRGSLEAPDGWPYGVLPHACWQIPISRKVIMKSVISISIAVAALLIPVTGLADELATICVKGTLQPQEEVRVQGVPPLCGGVEARVCLYSSASAPTALWERTTTFDLDQGSFSENIPVADVESIVAGTPVWLGLTLGGGEEFRPRIKVSDHRAHVSVRVVPASSSPAGERVTSSTVLLRMTASATLRSAGATGMRFPDPPQPSQPVVSGAIDLSRAHDEWHGDMMRSHVADQFVPALSMPRVPDLTFAGSGGQSRHDFSVRSTPWTGAPWTSYRPVSVPDLASLNNYEFRWNNRPSDAPATGPVWVMLRPPTCPILPQIPRSPDPARQIRERMLALTRPESYQVNLNPGWSLTRTTPRLPGLAPSFNWHTPQHHPVGSLPLNLNPMAGTMNHGVWNLPQSQFQQACNLKPQPFQLPQASVTGLMNSGVWNLPQSQFQQNWDFTPQPFQFPQVPVCTPQWDFSSPAFQTPQIPTYTPPVFGQ